MIKYTDTLIGFQEFPDEIALCINISNCPFHCSGCHSPELWKDIGKPLTQRSLERLISENHGITLVGFMGGEPSIIDMLAEVVHRKGLKVGWYWGGDYFPKDIHLDNFDYIKLGPYKKEFGGLNNPNTNQRFYAKGIHLHKMDVNPNIFYDVTDKFWKNGNNN